jgi:hypothetical protein
MRYTHIDHLYWDARSRGIVTANRTAHEIAADVSRVLGEPVDLAPMPSSPTSRSYKATASELVRLAAIAEEESQKPRHPGPNAAVQSARVGSGLWNGPRLSPERLTHEYPHRHST